MIKIHETIKSQLIDAMRAKDSIKLDTLRGLLASFSYELIAKKSSDSFIDDESALKIIIKSVKQHKDSIEQFTKGNRADLADKEKKELVILEVFLPKMMDKNEVKTIVEEKIKAIGTVDKAKIGAFIGQIMRDLKGKADGTLVKEIVDEIMKV